MKRIYCFILTLLLLPRCCFAEDEFEASKYMEGKVCLDMVDIWFTDVSVQSFDGDSYRYITKINRKLDGTIHLKGYSENLNLGGGFDWEISGNWSCFDDWYVEKSDFGRYTAFKIQSVSSDKIVLVDELNNFNTAKKTRFSERKSLEKFVLDKYPFLR